MLQLLFIYFLTTWFSLETDLGVVKIAVHIVKRTCKKGLYDNNSIE